MADHRLIALMERCDTALLTTGDHAAIVLDRTDIALLAEYLPDLIETVDRDQGRHVLGVWAVYVCGCSYVGELPPATTCQTRGHTGVRRVMVQELAFPKTAPTGFMTARQEDAALRRQGLRA